MGELDHPTLSGGDDEARATRHDHPEPADQPATSSSQAGQEAQERQAGETRTREEYASHVRDQGSPAPGSDHLAQPPAAQQENGQAREQGTERRAEPRDRESYANDIHATSSHDTGRAAVRYEQDEAADSQARPVEPAPQPAEPRGRDQYAADLREAGGSEQPTSTDATSPASASAATDQSALTSSPEQANTLAAEATTPEQQHEAPTPAAEGSGHGQPDSDGGPDSNAPGGHRLAADATGQAAGTSQVDRVSTEADNPAAGRPDIASRYPSDYTPALSPSLQIEGAHEQPETWVGNVNPDKRAPGRDNNCGECSRAVDQTWNGDGHAAAAMADANAHGEPTARMTEWAGEPPVQASMSDIGQRLQDLGPGSSAVVGCDWKYGGGHWFNAVNDGGTVKAIDGQSGSVEHWPPSARGLGFDESDMRYSDAIFFTVDGKVSGK